MFHVRTIRRKMVSGFVAGIVMLIALCITSIWGLRLYKRVMDDFAFSIDELPRKNDLANTFGRIMIPLEVTPLTPGARRDQLRMFGRQLDLARKEVNDFMRLFNRLPPGSIDLQRRHLTESMLDGLHRRLDEIERQAGLADGEVNGAGERAAAPRLVSTRRLRELVAGLFRPLDNIPYVAEEFVRGPMQRDRHHYEVLLWLVTGITIAAVLLFGTMVLFGYRWIFEPLRCLFQGARRVAQGDFDYRITLNSRDEMGRLAESFNQMADRFQETELDLEQQVRERSRQLVRSERLAGVGFLAAGVAHEINNPLSAVVMASDSLTSRLSELLPDCDSSEIETVRTYLKMIQTESYRCRDITQKLLDFSRGETATRCTHDLSGLVAEVLTMVGHLSKFRDRRIEYDGGDPVIVEIIAPQIKQVVLNLVANALESMSDGGTLQIRILRQTDYVTVEFEDDGCGMTSDVIQNLFEPFFTQRREGRGTGLGLSISDRIVKEHQGTIEAHSGGAGQGSLFRLRLPRKAAAQAVA